MVLRLVLGAILFWGLATPAHARYRKAVEGDEVVLGKLYPKEGRVELGLGAGFIMNQAYLSSGFVAGQLTNARAHRNLDNCDRSNVSCSTYEGIEFAKQVHY